MAGMTEEKVVLDYCLKLPTGMKELCEEDAVTYAALACASDVPASKCEFGKKEPADPQAAEAWKNLNLVIKGKAKEAYALPDMPPAKK